MGNYAFRSYSVRESILNSPVMSVTFLKPNYIEYTANSVMINVNNFNDVTEMIMNNGTLDKNVKDKIIYALNHQDMNTYYLDKMRNIHIIDCNCNCILKITNESQISDLTDRSLAINMSALRFD